LRKVGQLRPHFCDQLAVICRFNFGETPCFGRRNIAKTSKKSTAGRRGEATPITAIERGFCCSNGALYILLASAWNQGPGLRRKRIDALEPFARNGIHPLAANQHLVFVHSRTWRISRN